MSSTLLDNERGAFPPGNEEFDSLMFLHGDVREDWGIDKDTYEYVGEGRATSALNKVPSFYSTRKASVTS